MIIKIIKFNEVYLKILTEPSIYIELTNYFSFRVPGFQFTPAFKNKLWDGYIRLFNQSTKLIYAGLYEKIVEFCQKSGYVISEDSYKPEQYSITKESIETYMKDVLKLASKGKILDVRDYQIESVYHCIANKRSTIVSPTSSGKSLMIYSLVRYLIGAKLIKRVLFIFPSVSLVTQMQKDFVDYSSVNGWDVDSRSHLIYSGQEKETNHPLVFSTYQSLTKLPPSFFNNFDCIVTDEAQSAQSKSIRDIMEKATNVIYRFGFTGSLQSDKCHHLVIEGLFGNKYTATTTNELMKRKEVSQLAITCIILKYKKETCKLISESDYAAEKKFLAENQYRNNFIKNLTISLKGNTLILFQNISQGKSILKMLKDVPNVHYIDGSTKIENREEVREIAEKSTNCILVASYGTMSTGVNIRKLDNCIFASPYKSKIKILQSLGRILRLAENKNGCKLFDIADNLTFKSKKNATIQHFEQRIEYYCQEHFNYKIIEYWLER